MYKSMCLCFSSYVRPGHIYSLREVAAGVFGNPRSLWRSFVCISSCSGNSIFFPLRDVVEWYQIFPFSHCYFLTISQYSFMFWKRVGVWLLPLIDWINQEKRKERIQENVGVNILFDEEMILRHNRSFLIITVSSCCQTLILFKFKVAGKRSGKE